MIYININKTQNKNKQFIFIPYYLLIVLIYLHLNKLTYIRNRRLFQGMPSIPKNPPYNITIEGGEKHKNIKKH